jgi:hypothetical protein
MAAMGTTNSLTLIVFIIVGLNFSKHIAAQKLTFQFGQVCDSLCRIMQNIANLGSYCPVLS